MKTSLGLFFLAAKTKLDLFRKVLQSRLLGVIFESNESCPCMCYFFLLQNNDLFLPSPGVEEGFVLDCSIGIAG